MKIADYLLESIKVLNKTLRFSSAGKGSLRNIMGSIMGLTFSKHLLLFLFDNRTKTMKILSTANFNIDRCRDILFDLDAGIEKKLQGRYFLSFNELKSIGVDIKIFNILENPRTIPLFVAEELVGILLAVSVRKNGYTPDDEEIFIEIQNNLAIYIRKNYSLRKLKKEDFDFARYTYPVAKTLYRSIYEFDEAKSRHDMLVDTIEVIIKYISVIAIALYREKGGKGQRTEENLKEFKKPSLGSWLNTLESIRSECPTLADDFFIEHFFPLIFEPRKHEVLYEICQELSSLVQREGNINKKSIRRLIDFLKFCIFYRNKSVGHGTLADGDKIKRSIELLQEAINCILTRLQSVLAYPLIYVEEVKVEIRREAGQKNRFFFHAFKECRGISIHKMKEKPVLEENLENGALYISNFEYNDFLPLHPIMIFVWCDEHRRDEIYFLDSIKDGRQADYICYQCGCNFKPKEYAEDVRYYFDLKNKKSSPQAP
jgi:hypothetical protein